MKKIFLSLLLLKNHVQVVNGALPSICGQAPLRSQSQPSSRIVNGQEATPGFFPWQVGVVPEKFFQEATEKGKTEKPAFAKEVDCGASVISKNLVLSASHCFLEPEGIYWLTFGDHHHKQDETTEQFLKVKNIIYHPEWNGHANDIVLLETDGEIIFKDPPFFGLFCLYSIGAYF